MTPASTRDERDRSLLRLLALLKQRDYRFITITPASHARIVARADRQQARCVEDVLGWSLPFGPGVLEPEIEECLAEAGMLAASGLERRALVRVSSLGGHLYLHSAYPTREENAVFFGPDSYRFADLVTRELEREPLSPGARIVDIGTGAGVGAITAASICPSAEVVVTDVNPDALRFTGLNASAAGIDAQSVEAAGLGGIDGRFDLAIINPPYIVDEDHRSYRDGGTMHGGELSLELAGSAMDRLDRGGRLILYTGSAIVRGRDALRDALARASDAAGFAFRYDEADPDVFGEELSGRQYRDVDRIALINCVISKPR